MNVKRSWVVRSTRVRSLARRALRWLPAAALALLPTTLGAQDPPTPQPDPDWAKNAVGEMLAKFAEAGVEVDFEDRTVTVEAEVGRPDMPLEYLLIHPRGKVQESVFLCRAKGSLLNAALLAIGVEKGRNARVVDKDPLPTLEEVEAGADYVDIFAPEGKPLWITAKWTDADGKPVEMSVGDLLVDGITGERVVGHEWIYIGGSMASMYRGEPPVFMADEEGNFVSIVYKEPPNHLVTMGHPHAPDDQIWWFTRDLPEPGTAVKVVFHRTKPPVVVAREKRVAAEHAAKLARVEAAGIVVDVAARTVRIPATRTEAKDEIAYLLSRPHGTVAHAAFVTDAVAELVDDALRFVDVMPGDNGVVIDRDPPPTPEELADGVLPREIYHARGKPLRVTLRWRAEPDAAFETSPLDELLRAGGAPLGSAHRWIYLGSFVAPVAEGGEPLFQAEHTGNLISLVYENPPTNLITLRDDRAAESKPWAVGAALPPPGTAVEIVIERL